MALANILRFGRALSSASDAVSAVRGLDVAYVTRVAASLADQSNHFGTLFARSLRFTHHTTTDGVSYLRVGTADGASTASTYSVGRAIQSGNLAEAVRLIDPSVRVPAETLAAFRALSRDAPDDLMAEEMTRITDVRRILEDLPASVSREVRSVVDVERLAMQNKELKGLWEAFQQNIRRAASGRGTGATIGRWVRYTLVAGAVAVPFILAQRARDMGSGCFQFLRQSGTKVRCKAIEYTIPAYRRTKKPCLQTHLVLPNKQDWNETTGACYKFCDAYQQYLNLDVFDDMHVLYACVNLTVWDVIADGVDGIINPATSLLKYAMYGALVLATGGMGIKAYAWYRKRYKRKKYDRLLSSSSSSHYV